MEIILLHLPGFLLFFCRITSFFVVSPFFSTRSIPMQAKIGLAFFVSFIIYTTVGTGNLIAWDGPYFILLLKEVFVGLLLGFIAYLFFTAVQVAGSFVDMQMGFAMANVIDPLTGAQSPILGNFKFMIAMLFFLSINGHHYLLQGIMESYQWIPLDGNVFSAIASGEISTFLLKSFILMFYFAFQMAAPLIVALFLTDVALGILAKTAPQFNVFVIGLPLKILVGFLMMLVVVSGFAYMFQTLFAHLFEAMRELLGIMG